MSNPAILGINFGQSFASIAVIGKEGHASCIANEEGERQIACAVSYNGEEVYIGNGAKPQLVKNGENTVIGFRNLLGHSYSEVEHRSTFAAPVVSKGDVPAYTVDILVPPPALATPSRSAAASGAATPAVREPTSSKHTITVPEITSLFLKTLFDSATDFIGAKPTGVVISCPSFFNEEQKKALTQAASDAGIPVLQILDETAAALVAYRVGLVEERKERDLLGKPDEGEAGELRDKIVAVVDLGETSLNVAIARTGEGEYVRLAQKRDDALGGRAFDDLLCAHFAKEFTKKTKVALALPCKPDASVADKRAEMKLRLAVDHTKRSLSASTGAATCAVESLKEGMDLSASINRIRFDGLAAGVYRKIGDAIKATAADAGLDLVQIDEVILVGASTLLPGIANNLRMLFPPAVPVTTTLDPSQVIAVGCALQAYHLAQLPEELPIPDILSATASKTVSAPVGIVFPGQPSEDDLLHAVIIPSGLRLPCRRQVQFEVTPGSTSVAVELWEGKYDVKVEKQEPTPRDPEDEEFSDDEEEEDIRTSICKRTKQLLAIEFPAEGKNEVTLEVIINEDGSVQCKPAQ